jgi:hypothetical protein
MQVLQNYFEASRNILDAAITTFKDHMANRSTKSTSPSNNAPAGNRENLITYNEGMSPAYHCWFTLYFTIFYDL